MDLILRMLYSSQSHLAIVSFHSILLYKHFSKSNAISQKRCKNQGTFTLKYLNHSSLSNPWKINTVTPLPFHSSSKYSKDANLSALEHGTGHKSWVNYNLSKIEKSDQLKVTKVVMSRTTWKFWDADIGLWSSHWATLLLQLLVSSYHQLYFHYYY